MTWSFAAAGATALCYGVATVLQALGARRTARGALELGQLVRLARELPFLAGLALDLVGFVFSLVALRSLPLFLVQSVIAANVGVTAVAAVLVLGARLRRPEVVAIVVLAVGLVLLAVAAKPGHARPLATWAQWLLLALLPLLVVGAVVAGRSTTKASGVALAAVAGTAFGAVGIAARGLDPTRPWWHAVVTPAGWAIAGFGVLGMLAFAAALQRGSATVVAAVVAGTETVIPAVVGFAALGDATRTGLGPVTVAAGFVLALGGVLLLTPYADLEATAATVD